MATDQVILVAVEDRATAGVVAVGAAHYAMDHESPRVVLLHVLDDHVIANGLGGLVGGAPPVVEAIEECQGILGHAEATLAAEYHAAERPLPTVLRKIGEGRAGPVIAQAATEANATAIVVGARRPHALGRLTHPDVVDYLRRHTALPVHVVALQAEASGVTGKSG